MGGGFNKVIDVYGVEMTSLEAMRFYKYIHNNRISMNTIYKERRKKIAKDWLNKQTVNFKSINS